MELYGQAVHGIEPTWSLYFPDGHAVHNKPMIFVLSVLEVYPILHLQSSVEALAASDQELSGHALHSDLSGEEYVPVEHCEHGLPAGPAVPGLHLQSCKAVLACRLLEFRGQSWHDPDPTLSLYLPALHAVHEKPFCIVYPLLHMQSVKDELPLCDAEPIGQFRHFVFDVRPISSEYVSAGHSWHTEEDAAAILSEYFPGLQLVHATFFETSLYLPASQAVQAWPRPEKPAMHRHLDAPSSLVALAAHGEQRVLPTSDL